MKHDKAITLIKAILFERIKISTDALCEENFDKPMTGNTFGFNAILLSYLLLEIEKAADIKFEPDDLTDYKFNTINSIARLIEEKTA